MDEDLNPVNSLAKGMHMFSLKHLVNRTVPFPEYNARLLDGI